MENDTLDRNIGQSKLSSSKLEAFVGKNSKIEGKLSFQGTVEIDGKVEGEVHSQERIIIGESADINARIEAVEVLVKGSVNGDIIASKKISLTATARVVGNLSGPSIVLEEGAKFDGRCSMTKAKVAPLTDSHKGGKVESSGAFSQKIEEKVTGSEAESSQKDADSKQFSNTTHKVIAIK